jgi:glycosyltransferase involved in cell wall biosynthesis
VFCATNLGGFGAAARFGAGGGVKSLHVPFGFFPDVVGGTEVYVASLAATLSATGHPAVIAAPGPQGVEYEYDHLRVHRFPVGDPVDLGELYNDGDLVAAAHFRTILERERPDVVHLHAFTRACSLQIVRAAHDVGAPVVFTYHTPTVSCQRGTLMRWGRSTCDGVLAARRCAACALHGYGVPAPFARVLAAVPTSVGRRLERARRAGGPWTALRFPALVSDRHTATRVLFREVDRIVALSDWTVQLLLANGVPREKVGQSRHGLSDSQAAPRVAPRADAALRVAFLGRIDRTKGLDTLVRAFKHIQPEVPIVLHAFGIVESGKGEEESSAVRDLARSEPRIAFKPHLEPHRVADALTGYDLLAVPSRWMETGPLVVLEAFAAGIPVVGSALGGIAELVEDGINGRLVADYDSPAAWARVLVELAGSRDRAETLRRGVRPPKSMSLVAGEMLETYEAAARARCSHAAASPSMS